MKHSSHRFGKRERGVVLVFTLIILLILVIGAVALMRSTQSSLFNAGNLAFRRDLVNQGEQAIGYVMSEFKPGAVLSGPTTANMLNYNFSAQTLATNTQGVPTVLLSDTAFVGTYTAADLSGPANSSVTMRYVIDRLCSGPGPSTNTTCVQFSSDPNGGTANATAGLGAPSATVYRVSVRVTGPRNTQVFLQNTFTKPD